MLVARILGSVLSRVLPPPVPRALFMSILVTIVVIIVVRVEGSPPSAPGSPDHRSVSALLDRVAVVPQRESVPGYERDCSGNSACVFGPAWSDSTGAPGSGNGCSTRHDVLARDLHSASQDPGDSCTVTGGVLLDPYTGQSVDARVTGIRGIHVDHVFPLAAAWDLGAWEWSQRRRAAFANDIDFNLLAVTGSVNSRKGDLTPADWLPPDPSRHCFYAARYLTAAVAYGLPVTAADHDALAHAVKRCP